MWRWEIAFLFIFAGVVFAEDEASDSIPDLSIAESESGSYAMTTIGKTKDGKAISVSILDWNPDGLVGVVVGDRHVPLALTVGRRTIHFIRPAQVTEFSHFEFFGQTAARRYVPVGSEIESNGLRLPLIDALKKGVQEGNRSVFDIKNQGDGLVTDPIHRKLTFKLCTVLIWHRTAAEQEFFGYPIRAAFVFTPTIRQLYHNLRANSASPTLGRLNRGPIDFIGDSNVQITNYDRCFGAAIRSLSAENQPPLAMTVNAVIKNILDQPVTKANTFHQTEELATLLLSIRDHLDAEFSDGKSVFFDPYARGFALEQNLWRGAGPSPTVAAILETGLKQLQKRGSPRFLQLFSYFLDLGYPVYSDTRLLDLALKRGFSLEVSAMILTKWGYPITNHHEAALKRLAQGDSAADRDVAVETLLMAGLVSGIPPRMLEDWFDNHVARETSQIRKLRAINVLMLTEGGRKYLGAHASSLTQEDAMYQLIRSIFRNEIKSAYRTGNFTLLNEHECLEFEKLFDVVGQI